MQPTTIPQKTQQSPVNKLRPQPFMDGKGIGGCRYLDDKGNVLVTESYYSTCKKRVYANGLTIHIWNNRKSATYTDGSKTGKEATEIMIIETGRGCTKDIQTTGELKRKIEEVRKSGLLVKILPTIENKKEPNLLGRLARHTVVKSLSRNNQRAIRK